MCAECKQEVIEILEKRMRRILEVYKQEPDDGIGDSHCFHLLEVQRILEGKPTCGVYDDYGPPLTIMGPHSSGPEGTPKP